MEKWEKEETYIYVFKEKRGKYDRKNILCPSSLKKQLIFRITKKIESIHRETSLKSYRFLQKILF